MGKAEIRTAVFVVKAKAEHGDKYDYSKTVYRHSKERVTIICPKHGSFEQTPNSHLNGRGCPACGNEAKGAASRLTQKQYIRTVRRVHGDKYDYSKAVYKGAHKKIEIICDKHGPFWQIANEHKKGRGCPQCGIESRSNLHRYNTEVFAEKAQEVHGNKYDYSLVNYKMRGDKISIVCPEHGEFKQSPADHLRGYGCPQCGVDMAAMKMMKPFDKLLSELNEVWGGDFPYVFMDISEYCDDRSKMTMYCPLHEEFISTPRLLLQKQGCHRCANTKGAQKSRLSQAIFLRKVQRIYREEPYDFSELNYVDSTTIVKVYCEKHGYFEKMPSSLLAGEGCAKCYREKYGGSKGETEVFSYLKDILPDVEITRHDWSLLSDDELDIVIPSLKLAIEYNELYEHSTAWLHRHYHVDKTNACNKVGYRLIHVWEDDWRYKKEAVKSLLHSVVARLPVVFARKTTLDTVSTEAASAFLEANHIQGYSNSSVAYGLFYGREIVSVCTFVKRKYGWELNRHACRAGIRVLGALGKYMANFKRTHQGEGQLISFCDLSMFSGVSYEKVGFVKDKLLKPDYKYLVVDTRKHKLWFRRDHLYEFLGDKFNPSMSEVQNMESNGYYRVFDCGKIRYTLDL